MAERTRKGAGSSRVADAPSGHGSSAVQVLENLFQVIAGALATGDEFPPSSLLDQLQGAAHFLPVEIPSVALGMHFRNGAAHQFGQKDVGQRFQDLRRNPLQDVRNSNVQARFIPADEAIRVGKPAEFM